MKADERRRAKEQAELEGKRARERAKEQKKLGEEVVLGFSVLEEKRLDHREVMRKRLFPVNFQKFVTAVQKVNIAGVRRQRRFNYAVFIFQQLNK